VEVSGGQHHGAFSSRGSDYWDDEDWHLESFFTTHFGSGGLVIPSELKTHRKRIVVQVPQVIILTQSRRVSQSVTQSFFFMKRRQGSKTALRPSLRTQITQKRIQQILSENSAKDSARLCGSAWGYCLQKLK
jgi:hypothetical protein